MNILVLGSNGFIGKRVVKLFSKHIHYKLFTIDCRLKDLKKIEEYILLNNIQVIIHLVSSLVPASNEEAFNKCFNEEIIPTYKLIDFSAKHNIKFIYFSSGGAIYGIHNLNLIDENASTNPINYYGYSKLLIENHITFINNITGLSYLILRPSNVYGIGQNFNINQGFITVAINKILNNETITVWGDGKNVKNYIYVDDLVNILEELLNNNVQNQILNISTDINYSLLEIITIFEKIFSKKIKFEFLESKKYDVKNFILSNQKLKSYINYDFLNLEEGIIRQIEDIKK